MRSRLSKISTNQASIRVKGQHGAWIVMSDAKALGQSWVSVSNRYVGDEPLEKVVC